MKILQIGKGWFPEEPGGLNAPEPFGRVIVEGMLCGQPVIAAAVGGATELVEPEKPGWLFSPGNSQQLAQLITAGHTTLR